MKGEDPNTGVWFGLFYNKVGSCFLQKSSTHSAHGTLTNLREQH